LGVFAISLAPHEVSSPNYVAQLGRGEGGKGV